MPVLHKNKAQNSGPEESHASQGCTKFWGNDLCGDNGGQGVARAGRSLLAKLSCIRPAQEQSSKLWSAEIQMHLRGARKFGQITFSAMADNQKRDPDEACWKHSLVPILRKIKAQNSGPEESQELHEHSGQLPVRQQSHITIGSRSMLVVKTLLF